MLGDDGGQPGQFGDLMPGGLGVVGTGLDRQRRVAVGTDRGDVGENRVDPIRGQANPVMPAMPGLTTRTSSGGRLAGWLGCVERVGRRWRGTIGGIAWELCDEFFDLVFKHGDPSQGDVEFTTQLDTSRTFRDGSRFERSHRV
jgi:hypothetical protein